MNTFKKTNKLLGLLMTICALFACSKMDDTYIDFVKKGSITYVGIPDSVKVHPGKNRLKLSWLITDPTSTQAKIFWRNKSDSLIVPIDLSPNSNKMDIWLNNMAEGTYSFDIKIYDKHQNNSVNTNVIGKVYGDTYINSLLARPVKSAIFENRKVTINWGSADLSVIGTQVDYTDRAGKAQQLFIPVTTTNSENSELPDYDMALHPTFSYTTLYVPDTLAIDTFFTAPQTVKVTGPPKEYVRTGWTAGTEDYDIPSGRVPQNVLDNNASTIWHMDKTRSYPHTITIDMKTVNLINGFTYNQRTPLDGAAKLVEIQVSTDNITWRSLGAYTFENLASKQYLDLLEPASFRYFKMVVRSDYKNGSFTAISEIGAYTR